MAKKDEIVKQDYNKDFTEQENLVELFKVHGKAIKLLKEGKKHKLTPMMEKALVKIGDNPDVSEQEKKLYAYTQYQKALKLIKEDRLDELTEDLTNALKAHRKMENHNATKNHQMTRAYEIRSEGDVHRIDLEDTDREGITQKIDVITEDGKEFDIEEFIDKELWKKYNQNIKVRSYVKEEGEIWKDPDYLTRKEIYVDSVIEYGLPKLTSIKKMVREDIKEKKQKDKG